jgi:cell division protein FtsI/penicillin-binding protein 2
MLNAILVLTWIVYLFQIQILDAHNLQATVDIRQNPAKKIITPLRGNIYDANQNLLASSIKYYQIDQDMRALRKYCLRNDKDITSLIDSIATIISQNSELKKKWIQQKLSKARESVFLTEEISETQLFQITKRMEQLSIPGLIKTFSKIKRSYPQGKLGSNFLGMTDDNREEIGGEGIYQLKGISGLEYTFNDKLSGNYGWQETIHDANNQRIPFLFLKERPPENGKSLVLTIDNDFQEILEESLSEGVKKYKAKNAIGIIM